MSQIQTEEGTQLQARMEEAKNKAAKELNLKPRYRSPVIEIYLSGSRGVAAGALLADTTTPPLDEGELRDLLSEIKRQGGFSDEEMKSCEERKYRFQYCTKA